MQERIDEFQQALASLDKVRADALFQAALKESPPIQVVERLMVPALEYIGQEWHDGNIALSQIYMGGRFCEDLVERVLPPSDPARKNQPPSAIVVLNDYHLLGKRIVYAVMRASGFELFDYGRMDVAQLTERVQADGVEVLMISVLMLPSALKVREVREALGSDIKILVGGAPFLFDEELWREVGADAMGRHAADAVRTVQNWMGGAL